MAHIKDDIGSRVVKAKESRMKLEAFAWIFLTVGLMVAVTDVTKATVTRSLLEAKSLSPIRTGGILLSSVVIPGVSILWGNRIVAKTLVQGEFRANALAADNLIQSGNPLAVVVHCARHYMHNYCVSQFGNQEVG